MSDVQQLIQASRLYYELGETQSRVAEILGVTRPQVSRLLKRARAEGIVEIRIVDGTAVGSAAGDELRRAVRARRGPSRRRRSPGPRTSGRRMIGRLGAEVLRGAIRDGAVVGVGDGASISAVADALAAEEPLHETGATVVPLCGGYWFTGPAREPFRRVADGIGGAADRASSRRASSTIRPRSARSSPTPAFAGSPTSGSGSRSRPSGSAGRRGAPRRSGRTSSTSSRP